MLEELTIERLSYGDDAIGHLADGKTAFIRGGCPGDRVLAEVVEDKGRFVKCTVSRILEPSAHRIEAQSPAEQGFGTCGWQHVSYERQLEEKHSNIVSQLIRNAGLEPERAESLVQACVPSERAWEYRNKLEFACETDEKGFDMGLRQRDGRKVVALPAYPLGAPQISKAAKSIRGALRYLSGGNDLGIYRIGIRHSTRTKSTEIALWTHGGNFPRTAAAKTLSEAFKATSLVRVISGGPESSRKVKKLEILGGNGYWKERLMQQPYRVSAPSFFQVNTEQAEKLIGIAIEMLDVHENDEVADLYCGIGSFTLPLARTGAHVYGVESSSSSIRDLRRLADESGLDIEAIGGDSARELPMLGKLDAMLVDPPRAGLDASLIRSIAEAAPKRLAYISCDPATWSRDVRRLEDEGYELASVVPVDLFPQTYHVEIASCFERKALRS